MRMAKMHWAQVRIESRDLAAAQRGDRTTQPLKHRKKSGKKKRERRLTRCPVCNREMAVNRYRQHRTTAHAPSSRMPGTMHLVKRGGRAVWSTPGKPVAVGSVAAASVQEIVAVTTPLRYREAFNAVGKYQLFRLEQSQRFICARCGQEKRSKLVAVPAGDWSKLTCNGCYGTWVASAVRD